MQLHPQIEIDSHFIGELGLSQLRLIPDGETPWFLLIPKGDHLCEWCDLSQQHQYQLTDEISFVSEILKQNVAPDKINVAALGNIVPQLHIHVIARYKTDRAWPHAIWGTSSTKKFDPKKIDFWKEKMSQK